MATTDMGTWHRLLLNFGGRLPDDALASARAALAASGPADTAAILAETVAELEIPITADEADTITGAADPELDVQLDRVPRQDDATAPAYRFTPSPEPIGRSFDGGPSLLLDLTGGQAGLRPFAADQIDEDAMGAVAGSTDPTALVALWRAWRVSADLPVLGPSRIYLLEVDLPAADLPAITAHVQEALVELGVANPQVEVYRPDWDLPSYHRLARGSSALLWAAAQAPAITTARVFDRVDPATGPQFDAAHPRVDDPAERERVLVWLEAGAVLLATTERAGDVLDPRRGAVVPLSYRTDGTWVWTDTVGYYLEAHHVAPDAELYDHIRSRGYAQPSVDSVAEHRALAYLFNPAPAPEPARS
jgi:hypothetical protein